VTHLRKAMLEELQRRNLSPITTRIYLHAVEEFALYYNQSPDRLGLEHIRQLSSTPVRRSQAGCHQCRPTTVRLAIFLPQDTQAPLEG